MDLLARFGALIHLIGIQLTRQFGEISQLLKDCDWSKDEISRILKDYTNLKNLKFKDIGYPLRIALTGKENSPDIASIIYELGCVIVTNRLNYNY